MIRCKTTADFLAAFPLIAGFTAANSIFVVLFSGRRGGRTVRVDLPPSDDPAAADGLINHMTRLLLRLGAGSGSAAPAIVITTDQTFAAERGIPWHRFARRLRRRLRKAGIELRELCCLAADGWAAYLDPDVPRGGRPLAEIAESPIALDARVSGDAPPIDLDRVGVIPTPSPERAAAVRAALRATPPPPGDGSAFSRAPLAPATNPQLPHSLPHSLPQRLFVASDAAESILSAAHPLDPCATAQLIRAAASPGLWLVIALGILTRPMFPLELAQEMGPEWFLRARATLSDAQPGADYAIPSWNIGNIITALGQEFSDVQRLPEISERLLTVISETPEPHRPPLLALSAWVWWLRGAHSVAYRHASAAIAIAPENELAIMVEEIVETRIMPRLLQTERQARQQRARDHRDARAA